MKDIAICGATGFVGRRLLQHLEKRDYRVKIIDREMLKPFKKHLLHSIVDSCDAVINLAGEPINRRWSSSYKKRLVDSRLNTTRSLVEAINQSLRVKLFVSASAAGFDSTDICTDDRDKNKPNSFLANLCKRWEAEARRVKPEVRLAIVRLGVVFAKCSGALQTMISTKKYGFVARIGSPKRRISWIDREDAIRAITYLLEEEELSGVINLVTEEQTTQQQFIDAVKRRWKVPLTLYVPKFILRLIYGASAEVITAEHCAKPQKLMSSGFRFFSPNIERFMQR